MIDEENEGLYIISIAARLARVHPQTLRLYERKGLLEPKRTPKNRRRYSDADINRLKHIQELTQESGLNLSGVQMVLDMELQIERMETEILELQKEAAKRQKQLIDEIGTLKKHVALDIKRPSGIAIRKKRPFMFD
jgi:MerR family transcriptional regulator, heat shock protein HspR